MQSPPFLPFCIVGPLDFGSDTFYDSRKERIDAKLSLISQATTGSLMDECRKIFTEKYGCQVIGVVWDNPGLESLLEFIECIGGRNLSQILVPLAQDYRGNRGGFPDLTLWQSPSEIENLNPADDDDVQIIEVLPSFKFVEVKSANDRLSDMQRNWRMVLGELGSGCMEICRVLYET